MTTSDESALRAIARYGLPGNTVAEIEVDERLFVDLIEQRLMPLTAAALIDGSARATKEQTEAIHVRWREELLASVVLEAQLIDIADLFDEQGIRWLVTKGSALAHLDYPEPSMRTFGDIDVVVHSEDWLLTIGCLTRAGLTRPSAAYGDRFDASFGKGATFTTASGLEVDLHLRFAVGRFGVTARMEEVFEHPSSFHLGGRSVPALSPEHRLIHACYHAVLGGFPSLRSFRDIAQLLSASHVDWEAAREVASRWQAMTVLASALKMTDIFLELEVDHPALRWAADFRVPRCDRRTLAVFSSQRSYRRQVLTTTRTLRPSQWVPFFAPLLAHRLALRVGPKP